MGSIMARTGRPKSENAKKKVLSIRVNADTYKRLCAYAEAMNMTITDVVLKGLDKILSDS